MTDQEAVRRWAETWKKCGPELEKIRLREVRAEDSSLSLRLLATAFNHATRTVPPDNSPGMVEMQRVFSKLRP